jgi:predicted AlkP superfamily phosphohydrolase/phosphomutase
MLVPTYRVNGWMVAGVGASKSQEWVWPSSLSDELNALAQPYEIQVYYALPKYRDNLEQLVRDLARLLRGRLSVLEHLLSKHPVDVLVAILSVTDFVSHTMWHLWDSTHPEHDALQTAALLPQVHSIWAEIDDAVGRLLDRLAPHGSLLILSDHGFGPTFGVFHTNRWLEQRGYLARRKHRWPSRLNNRLRAGLVSALEPVLEPLFKRLQGTPAHFALRESVLREIDLRSSKAFALETTDVCGMVFVNRQYARLRGLDEEQFVEQMTLDIRRDLELDAREMDLKIAAYSSQDLYAGESTVLAPEVLFCVDDYAVSVSHRFADQAYEPRLHHPAKTGNHRQDGVFVAYGDKIRRGVELAPLSILDVAPTAYHLLGEAVPAGLDGRVATEACLSEYSEFAVSAPAAAKGASGPTESASSSDAHDGEELKQRLRALGYVD